MPFGRSRKNEGNISGAVIMTAYYILFGTQMSPYSSFASICDLIETIDGGKELMLDMQNCEGAISHFEVVENVCSAEVSMADFYKVAAKP